MEPAEAEDSDVEDSSALPIEERLRRALRRESLLRAECAALRAAAAERVETPPPQAADCGGRPTLHSPLYAAGGVSSAGADGGSSLPPRASPPPRSPSPPVPAPAAGRGGSPFSAAMRTGSRSAGAEASADRLREEYCRWLRQKEDALLEVLAQLATASGSPLAGEDKAAELARRQALVAQWGAPSPEGRGDGRRSAPVLPLPLCAEDAAEAYREDSVHTNYALGTPVCGGESVLQGGEAAPGGRLPHPAPGAAQAHGAARPLVPSLQLGALGAPRTGLRSPPATGSTPITSARSASGSLSAARGGAHGPGGALSSGRARASAGPPSGRPPCVPRLRLGAVGSSRPSASARRESGRRHCPGTPCSSGTSRGSTCEHYTSRCDETAASAASPGGLAWHTPGRTDCPPWSPQGPRTHLQIIPAGEQPGSVGCASYLDSSSSPSPSARSTRGSRHTSPWNSGRPCASRPQEGRVCSRGHGSQRRTTPRHSPRGEQRQAHWGRTSPAQCSSRSCPSRDTPAWTSATATAGTQTCEV
eukprot:TRINITY_DN25613_c0_g1_i1.p1 TRINITY_DN25613_c0_g1~~TRINITY_DN25613_c0_g1_i1.p1  ORF type:complete len:595 (+),score=94.14 TRINITY_DN25613_c0_g1_i1:191-1786(+)